MTGNLYGSSRRATMDSSVIHSHSTEHADQSQTDMMTVSKADAERERSAIGIRQPVAAKRPEHMIMKLSKAAASASAPIAHEYMGIPLRFEPIPESSTFVPPIAVDFDSRK